MNKTTPNLSVIIPVHNAEEFLHRAIDSVLACSLKNIEIIVVDDGSKGNCKSIVDSYSGCVRYIRHAENKSLFSARYTGISVAKGDYIAHLDADDWIVNDAYTKAYRRGKELDADVVYFNLLQCNESGKTWNDKKNIIHPFELKTGRDIIDEIYLTQGVWALHVCWNKLIRREVALQLLDDFSGDEYVNMFEDALWSTALFLKIYNNGRIAMITDVGIMYYRHEKSITLGLSHELMAQKIDNTFSVYEMIKNLLDKYQLFPRYQYFYNKKMHNALAFPVKNLKKGFSKAFPKQFEQASNTLDKLDTNSNTDRHFQYSCTRICEKVKTHKPQKVFLYGSDTLAKLIFEDISDMNINTLGFVVTDKQSMGKTLNNIPVYSICDVQHQEEFKDIIVGSISSFYEIRNSILNRRPDANVIGVFN